MIVENTLINFYREGNIYTIEVRDLDNASDTYYAVETFRYSSNVPADEGSLVLFDNTIFIEPHNKQLNLIEGKWYLNDFVSTTPLIRVLPQDVEQTGTKSIGFIQLLNDVVFPNLYRGVFTYSGNPPIQPCEIEISFANHVTIATYNPTFDLNTPVPNIVAAINADQDAAITADEFNGNVRITAKPGVDVDTFGGASIFIPTDAQPVGSGVFPAPNILLSEQSATVDLFLQVGAVSQTLSISSGDNILQIIQSALQSTSIGNNHNIYIEDNTLFIQRNTVGNYSKSIRLQILPENAFEFITQDIDGGSFGRSVGELEQEQEYWYMARYRYFDGHLTKTCFPVYAKTSNLLRQVQLSITTTKDLDLRPAFVEIFRKRDDEEFFLIDSFRPDVSAGNNFIYLDTGKANEAALDQQNYVWSTLHKSQAVVRDRYVRANVEYPKRSPDGDYSVNTEESTGDKTIPRNVSAQIYVRGKNQDGVETFFKQIGTVTNEDSNSVYRVTQANVPRSIKELAYYAKYTNTFITDGIVFNSPELYNQNIPSIATRSKPQEERDTPINPHLFLAWSNICVVPYDGQLITVAYDYDWSRLSDDFNFGAYDNRSKMNYGPGAIRVQVQESIPQQARTNPSLYPNEITVNVFGRNLKYVKKYIINDSQPSTPGAYCNYELAILEGLQTAVNTIELTTTLRETSGSLFISNVTGNTNLLNLEEQVVGVVTKAATNVPITYIDISDTIPRTRTRTPNLTFFRNNRIYLQYSTESALANVNNPAINNQVFGSPLTNDLPPDERTNVDIFLRTLNNQSNLSFRINDVRPTKFSETFDSQGLGIESIGENQIGVTEFISDYGIVGLRSLRQNIDALFYLGSTPNTINESRRLRPDNFTLPVTGFTVERLNKFEYNPLSTANIFETLILETDLQQLQNKYPNQIIWSEPFVRGTNASGIRNFTFTNFLNVNPDYGQIIDLHYINNSLLVFTNYAVGIINVGETLTQQPSGQTVVDSSGFLTGQSWVLTKLNKVQRNSIRRYENMLLFSDSQDVWMFDGQFRNITNGAIELANEPHIGAIDPENKEYRITDANQTWAYSFEMQEWFGPYTYRDQENIAYRSSMLSINGDDLVKHNETNLFHFTPYDTVIESISNDLNDPSTDKIFRKFYFDIDGVEGTEFEYYKKPGTNTKKIVAESARRNENWHVGVDSNNQNSKQIFWKFKTRAEGFVLKMLAFMYNPRIRR